MLQRHWISALALGAALAVSAPALAQAPVANATSSRLMQQANALMSQSRAAEAADLYEAALVADPRNSNAFIGLGRAYERMGMTGRAISYYRKALTINPNDVTALEASGMALITKGSLAQAQETLDRLRRVCPKGCVQAERLANALGSAQAKSTANRGRVTAQSAPRKPARQQTSRQ